MMHWIAVSELGLYANELRRSRDARCRYRRRIVERGNEGSTSEADEGTRQERQNVDPVALLFFFFFVASRMLVVSIFCTSLLFALNINADCGIFLHVMLKILTRVVKSRLRLLSQGALPGDNRIQGR